MKLESVKSKHPQLLVESRIYKLLQDGGMYLAQIFWYLMCYFVALLLIGNALVLVSVDAVHDAQLVLGCVTTCSM